MAVEISDNKSFELDARINLSQFRKDAHEIKAILTTLGGGGINFNVDGVTSGFEKIGELIWVLKEAFIEINAELANLSTAHNAGAIDTAKYAMSLDILIKKQTELKESITSLADAGKNDRLVDVLSKGATFLLEKAIPELAVVDEAIPGLTEGILGLAIDPLVDYIANLDLFSEKIGEAVLLRQQLSSVQLKGNQDAQLELVQLQTLQGVITNTSLSMQQRNDAVADLQKKYPQYLGNIDKEILLAGGAKGAYDKLTNSILATARARAAQEKMVENSMRVLADEAKITEERERNLKIREKVSKLENAYKSASDGDTSNNKTGSSSNVLSLYNQLLTAQEELAQSDKIITDAARDKQILISRNAKLNDSVTQQIVNGANLSSTSTKSLTEQEKSYQLALSRREGVLSNFSKLSTEYANKNLSQEEQAKIAVERRFEEARKQLVEYNKWASEYNKTAPASKKVKNINPGIVADAKKNAVENLTYQQDTEKLKSDLEQQKQLYSDFQQTRITVGEKAAKELYGNDLDISKTFMQKLQDEQKKLADKDPAKLSSGEKGRLEMLNDQIKAEKYAEKQKYIELLADIQTYEQKVDNIRTEYAERYISTAAAQNGQVTDEQKKQLNELESQAIDSLNAAEAEKLAVLQGTGQEIIEMSRGQILAYIKTLENIHTSKFTDEQRKKYEENIERLKTAIQGVNGPAKLYTEQQLLHIANLEQQLALQVPYSKRWKEILKDISEVNQKLSETSYGKFIQNINTLKQGASFKDIINGASEDSGTVENSVAKGAAKVAIIADNAKSIISDIQSSLSGLDQNLDYTIGQIGGMVNIMGQAAEGTANLAAGIASGNPLMIVNGAISLGKAVAGVFSMGKKVKEMNAAARAEVQKFYDNAKKGEMEYQALLRKREQEAAKRGKTSYQGIIAELDAIKKNSPAVKKAYDEIYSSLQGQEFVEGQGYKHGTWLKKAKTWDIMASLSGADYSQLEELYIQGKLKDKALADFEALKRLREELEAAEIDVAELEQQLKEMLTGTSVEGLSDALASLFENGKYAAEDFSSTFENIVGKAILNTFKYSVIEKAMSPLFDALVDMTEGGKIPSPDEVASFLDSASAVGQSVGAQWNAIQEGMEANGMDLFGDQDTSAQASNTIQASLTEDTANRALGIWNGMFDINKRQLAGIEAFNVSLLAQQSIAMDGLRSWQAIEMNTANTVVRLDSAITELKAINKNTGGMSSRDMGV